MNNQEETLTGSMTEYFEIFDQHNQPLHYTKLRSEVHRDGDWHRTVQIFVINEQEQLLCNLRSKHKDVFPLYWDVSIGGHVSPDESSLQTATRELNEELGISIQPHELRFVTHFSLDGFDETTRHTDREHAAIFIFKTHLTTADFKMAADEIDALEYFPIPFIKENLVKDIPSVRFIPLKNFYPELLDKVSEFINV